MTPKQVKDAADRAERKRDESRDTAGRFVTGAKPGPGRPKGSRNALAESFIDAMHADFAEHGVSAIHAVREEKPDQYLKVIASILPKELTVNVNEFEGMSDGELIDRLRQLDAVVRPFLDSAAEGDDREGAAAATTH